MNAYWAPVGPQLQPYEVQPGNTKEVSFNLIDPLGIIGEGYTFQVQVLNWLPDTDFNNQPLNTNPTWLTFKDESENEAVYIVSGDPKTPTITFKEIRPFGNIIVSNDGTVNATVYARNDRGGILQSLKPDVKALEKNVVIDLTKCQWLNDGVTFRLEIAEHTDPTWLKYRKDSENEAVYTVTYNAGQQYVSFQGLRPIPDNPSPPLAQNVRQITLLNSGSFISTIYSINAKTEHVLVPDVPVWVGSLVYDLTTTDWLTNGDTFQVKVICATTEAPSTDPTWLTLTNDAMNEAVYTITGDPTTPVISFKEIRPIVDTPPLENISQISVSDSGTFIATIYSINTDTQHVLEADIQVEVKNAVFDLTKVHWLKDGDELRLKVTCTTSKAQSTDATWVKFTSKSNNEAVYEISGSADKPNIAFKMLRAIGNTAGPIVSE
ncbi:hypothetical protein BDP27DRAFT_1445546 [Rhodocollybia butyracea]|uniref:Uncharacterized protein n=1 Tax=Rhodocollybia butyracea TaxID=206335 RepID=A0A9P5Q1W9_9AGAR|nr:hypothetical protein BDP27DRAFT_1445546 [Rhodocollybia butyracea]